MKFTVTASEKGERVDKILQNRMQQFSRSQIQKLLLETDVVSVQGKPASKNYRVQEGDIILITLAEEQKTAPSSPSYVPEILFENEEYMVFNKPAGLLVHPTVKGEQETMVDVILAKHPSISKVGDDPLRPGIVHRLDKDASGVMVVPKTQSMFDCLKRQFKLREVKKQYLIVVYGAPSKPAGEIRFSLGRSRHSPRIVARSGEGRTSVTRYWVEKNFGRYSLIRVEPQTGRTHQIRVHFFAFGYPLVGDPVYVPKKTKRVPDARLMLHATLLGFRDLSGAWQEYTCPPSKDFADVLDSLMALA